MSGAAREDEEDGAGAAHVVVITHPPEATGWEGPGRNDLRDVGPYAANEPFAPLQVLSFRRLPAPAW